MPQVWGVWSHSRHLLCATPFRGQLRGLWSVCGQYGHMRRHCSVVTRASHPQQQVNVAYSGGAFSGNSSDGDSVNIRGGGTLPCTFGGATEGDGMGSDRHCSTLQFTFKAERPMKRVFVDLTGPYLTSVGGTRYSMLIVDDCTNVGWTLFLRGRVVIPYTRPSERGTPPSRALQPFT